PCIDTGDPSYPLDPDGTIADMGAFYFDQNQQEIEDISVAPISCNLYQNYPNPFNPSTTISFSLTAEDPENSELSIYNIKGQKVKTLVNEVLSAGEHSIIWDGNDYSGKPVGSGIYLYKLSVNGKTEAVKKCLFLK
ncbi:MAG: T9SS type A sorting domain-containing protein, partial [Candidatus Cloacimonetes bacterium]|nr:T9SS type A sorting domain-containing protein [Candidatus Cloacimonadota bacterium]